MISDRRLMQICILTAAAGLIALYVIVTFTEPRAVRIEGLKTGENVLVRGMVSDYTQNKGNVFFQLTNGSSVRVVMFANEAERNPRAYELKDGDAVTLKGKVQHYRNSLEIIAQQVW